MSDHESSALFVGNLSFDTTDRSLYEAFEKCAGEIIEARIFLDRYTGRSRGYGFVTFGSPDQAAAALRQMNGAQVDGRSIHLESSWKYGRNARQQDDSGRFIPGYANAASGGANVDSGGANVDSAPAPPFTWVGLLCALLVFVFGGLFFKKPNRV